MAKKIMILGASILQLPAIEKAIELGLETIVVDMNPKAVGFKVKGVVKEVISTIDVPAIIEAAKRHNIDGIMTLATDMPMRAVAAVAKELNLIGISEDTAIKATNKSAMRLALQKCHVPIPNFFSVSNLDEFNYAKSQFENAFIIKPADSSGSRGINLIDDINDDKKILEAYENCRKYSKCGDVMVEEYMSGPEVSVETLTYNGECRVIQITDKLTTGAPHFVEIGHSQPTKHSSDVAKEITEIAIAANKAIGINNGPSHTEIILTDEGPKIVELGARLGGDNINTHLVPLSTGINIVEACIRIALGEKPDIKPLYKRGAAIRYFEQHAGVIKNITGIEEAEKVNGVRQISFVQGIGDNVSTIDSSGARIGFVIAQGENVDEAISACRKAIDCIEITIGG